MCCEQEGVGFAWVDVIGSPRVERSAITFETDVTDRGVRSDECSTLLVVALVVGAYLVAF